MQIFVQWLFIVFYQIMNETNEYKEQFRIFGDTKHVRQDVIQLIITYIHNKHGNPIILYVIMLVLCILFIIRQKDKNLQLWLLEINHIFYCLVWHSINNKKYGK